MRKMRTLPAVMSMLAVAMSPQLMSATDTQLVTESLDTQAPYVTGELVVQFRGGTTEVEKQGALRGVAGAPARPVIREQGEYDVDVVSFGALIPIKNAMERLAQDPAVESVEPNWIYTRDQVSNDPIFTTNRLWGMYGDASSPANEIGSGASERWAAGQVGSRDVYVGVIDEGIMWTHEDLRGNVFQNPFDKVDGKDNDRNGYVDDIRGWDFSNKDRSIFDGKLDNHGTHVAGTIGAKGGNGVGVAGVNWKVTMIPAKFLDGPKSQGTLENAVKAINYITRLKKLHRLNIVATNNSWGGGGYSRTLLKAINRGGDAGILFVAAAGNDHVNTDRRPHYPSSYKSPYIISVAAIDVNGKLAPFSNVGADSVDLGAPGVDIISTVPKVRDGKYVSGYASFHGTSMAVPHVTGMIALLASIHPGKTALELKQLVLSRAVPTPSLRDRTRTGGRLSNGL